LNLRATIGVALARSIASWLSSLSSSADSLVIEAVIICPSACPLWSRTMKQASTDHGGEKRRVWLNAFGEMRGRAARHAYHFSVDMLSSPIM
jgi:hypothetical protein